MKTCDCKNCPFHSTKKTKFGTYDWCKKHACSVSSPKNPCGKENNPNR